MMSIKVSVVLLAAVCLFYWQESSAFIVKRDANSTDEKADKVGWEEVGKSLNSFINLAKDYIDKIPNATEARLAEARRHGNETEVYNEMLKKIDDFGKEILKGFDDLDSKTDEKKP